MFSDKNDLFFHTPNSRKADHKRGGGATLTASLTVKYLLFLQLPVANVSNYTFFGVICLPQKLRSHIFGLKNIKSDFGGHVTFSIHYISVVGFNTEHKVC